MTDVWETQALATQIAGHLNNPVISFPAGVPAMRRRWFSDHPTLPLKQPFGIRIRGDLPLSLGPINSKRSAHCEYTVFAGWRAIHPHLECRENWVRRPGPKRNVDWHILPDGSFCYVLNAQWRDCVRERESQYGTSIAIADSAFYAINNGRWLLWHHLYAYRNNITEWQRDWPEWPHYEAGLIAYQQAKLRSSSHD
jgi:hypothetical protein